MVATHVKGSDSLLAAMEENLGKNIGQDIQQSSQGVMDNLEKRYNADERNGHHYLVIIYILISIIQYRLHFRFEKMTQQLAVIKKYAKHGPSGGDRVSDIGVPAGGSPGACTPKLESSGMAASSSTADMLATVSGESKVRVPSSY